MKNAIFSSLFFIAVLFPSLSHAQFVPFGGRQSFTYPGCTCTPIVPILTCSNPLPEPPLYIFHGFSPLWLGTAGPIGGWLAQLIAEPALVFPNYALLPGTWAIGEVIPVIPSPVTTCGIYIPFPGLLALCATLPGYAPAGVVGVCAPIAAITAIGIVTPFTGTGIGGW